MLNPEQRAELVESLRLSEESNRAEAALLLSMGCDESAEDFSEKADQEQAIITALTNELALAEQVRVLTEAASQAQGWMQTDIDAIAEGAMDPGSIADCQRVYQQLQSAIALDLLLAARQAAENAERAGLLEELIEAIRQGQDKGSDESDTAHSIAKAEGIIAKAEALRAAKEAGNG